MLEPLNSVIELLNRWGEIHWNFAALMFLQVSVLIVVLLCLDLAVLRRLRASIRYALWMLVLVKLMVNNLAAERHLAPDGVVTDTNGQVTVGGLVPAKTEYLIATWKDGYAFERLVVKLDDPQQIPEKEIVLHAGKTGSDGRLRATLIPDRDDGSYRVEHLPAGEYLIRKSDTRDGHVIQKVTLQEGEEKTLDFTSETIAPDTSTRGLIVVRTYTSNGVPFPCRPYLEGPEGKLPPRSSQRARAGFVGKPGTYTLLVEYPGFEAVRRQVEMSPVNQNGTPTGHYRINVFLNEAR